MDLMGVPKATIRTTLVATAVTAVLAVTATAATPVATAESTATNPQRQIVTAQGPLRDLEPAAAGPLDGAKASLAMVSDRGRTVVALQVEGIDKSVAGRKFGTHLHVGPCVAGDGAAAGPHYNTDVLAGHVPPRIDQTTEVWLDITVTADGTGPATTTVPFTPTPGIRSIVVHRDPTDHHHGTAGPRLACLPVAW